MKKITMKDKVKFEVGCPASSKRGSSLKFEDELLSVRCGKIPENAGLFPVKYENADWEI